RTDRTGMEAAARHMTGELLRIEIRDPAFHGNMAFLPLCAAGRALVCPSVVVGDGMDRLRRRFGGDALIEVTEAEIRSYAPNGLPIDSDVLAPSIVPPRVAELVRDAGMRVVPLSMGELCEKAGGASRCLVSYARLDLASSGIHLPADARLARVAA